MIVLFSSIAYFNVEGICSQNKFNFVVTKLTFYVEHSAHWMVGVVG